MLRICSSERHFVEHKFSAPPTSLHLNIYDILTNSQMQAYQNPAYLDNCHIQNDWQCFQENKFALTEGFYLNVVQVNEDSAPTNPTNPPDFV